MNQTKYSNDRSLSIPTCKSLRIRPTCLSGPTNQAHYLLSDHYMHPFHKSQNLIMICNRPAGADRQAGVPRRMRCGDRGHGRVAAALGNCNVSTAFFLNLSFIDSVASKSSYSLITIMKNCIAQKSRITITMCGVTTLQMKAAPNLQIILLCTQKENLQYLPSHTPTDAFQSTPDSSPW